MKSRLCPSSSTGSSGHAPNGAAHPAYSCATAGAPPAPSAVRAPSSALPPPLGGALRLTAVRLAPVKM
eukprot:5086049-Prymnesium_polylepis.1